MGKQGKEKKGELKKEAEREEKINALTIYISWEYSEILIITEDPPPEK